uniref:Uncharacterized protein n=1 Tax=Mycena chlorophos TaxID=658473 RepID=A0ABQ0LUQ9_MYCCL|nr:predicted protein [Mycena chlorophos]
MSDSSASTTPMVLTPDSTGIPAEPDVKALKKARRQTAFYPNINSTNKPQKPFSRSAAKRESVMALGSIEHLQHYFTKTGIEAKRQAGKTLHGLVPVFGGLTHTRNDSGASSIIDLPPSPAVPQPAAPAFPPYVKNFEMDPESLLPGVIDDLSDVAFVWRIDQPLPPHGSPDRLGVADAKPPDAVEVLTILKTTTRAIRTVRNYLLSLPDESAGTIRAQFRSRHLPSSYKPAVPSSLSRAGSSSDLRGASNAAKDKDKDPLSLIRKAALEVLTVLRDMEEGSRLPLSDDAYDAQSDGGSKGGHSRVASPSAHSDELSPDEEVHERERERDGDHGVAFSLVQVNGQSVPVWEDDEDTFNDNDDDEKEKKEGWDEKLVLGSGWLYRQDIRLGDLGKERAAVAAYLDVVDDVLFEGKNTPASDGAKKERGWERERRKALDKGTIRSRSRANRRAPSDGESSILIAPVVTGSEKSRRRVSVGMFEMMGSLRLTEEPEDMDGIGEEDEAADAALDDEELPEWARRSTFANDDLGRAHALISTFLPPALLSHLASSSSRSSFLDSLSSGQLLCAAYNSCVRRSKKPWGFISRDGIHDIIALEQAAAEGEEVKKGWTFRRIDNLRLWAGALKIRYLLPIISPPQPGSASGTPLNSPSATTSQVQRFNPEQPPVVFDAKVVARKDPGWEDILENAIIRWMQSVVAEKRGET